MGQVFEGFSDGSLLAIAAVTPLVAMAVQGLAIWHRSRSQERRAGTHSRVLLEIEKCISGSSQVAKGGRNV
jgi:hypothetical protein